MNADDIVRFGFQPGNHVDIVSYYDDIERKAENFIIIPYKIPRQNIATYFPEANAVVPYNRFADKSQTPISKSVVVKLLARA